VVSELLGAQGAPSEVLGRAREWPEVGFPRRPRRQRRGARQREGSGEEVGKCSGPEAATGGEEVIGTVESNGEGVEGGVRR
jgi:hypothetical protein